MFAVAAASPPVGLPAPPVMLEGHRPVGLAPGVENLPAQQQTALAVDVEALPETVRPHQLHQDEVGGTGGHVGARFHRQAVLGGG